MNTLTAKRTHFPRTTASQRKLLFHTWQTTGDVKLACHKGHVSERTFYKWKLRFDSGGYEALEQFASHAPKRPHRTMPEVEKKVSYVVHIQNGAKDVSRMKLLKAIIGFR